MLFGTTAVFVALAFALATVFAYLFGKIIPWGRRLYLATVASIFTVEGYLIYLLMTGRYEINYVWQFSERNIAWYYKLAGAWGGQEGSFLLWTTLTALLGLVIYKKLDKLERPFMVAFTLILASLVGILAFKTPFAFHPGADAMGYLTDPASGHKFLVTDGLGLNPSLENYWMTIHPPIMFTGFASLGILFCFAIAALVKRDTKTWQALARPWAAFSAATTGLGLCLGGFWAYETLGWGGFWAWDPVENVSFIPWLGAVALLHGLYVFNATGKGGKANLFFAAFPFMAFMFGTFLTRSGTLSDVSVHSFVNMEEGSKRLLIGMVVGSILAFVSLFTWTHLAVRRTALYWGSVAAGAGLLTWSLIVPGSFMAYLRWPMGIWTVGMLGGMAWSFFRPESWSVPTRGDFEEESGVPRRYGLYAGISAIMFMSLCALLGTAWPWLTFLLSGKSVKLEEDFYNRALLLPAVIVLILSALVPFLGWHRTDGKRFFNRMLLPWTAAATLAIVGFFAMGIRNPFGLVVAVICFLTVTANAWRISEVIRRSRVTVGGFIAHMGVAILLLGMVVSRGFERKEQVLLPKNEPAEGLGFTITRGDDRLLPASTAMKQMKELPITFVRGDQKFVALPEYWQRLQPGDPNPQRMTRPWIKRGFDNDIYVSIRPPENVFDARGQVQISPGETKKMGPFTITRIGALTMKGQPGQVGTTFSAHFHVVHPTGSFDVEPALQMTEDGLQAMPQDLGQGIGASIGPPQGMNGPILFQLGTITDLLPVELFHKPLTILVWLGAGIMACGGFLSVRRRALDARALARQRALTSHEENGHPHASHPTSKKQNTPRKGKLHKSRLHRKY